MINIQNTRSKKRYHFATGENESSCFRIAQTDDGGTEPFWIVPANM
jgi:hypothetical protein